jgi:AcrR family transcriptional regulator
MKLSQNEPVDTAASLRTRLPRKQSAKRRSVEESETTSRRQSGRRDLLRQEGARAFAERGYHGASVQEVADVIGFTKASIYYYYKSKEELLFDVLTFAHDEISALFAHEAVAGHDALTHVGKLVSLHVTWYLEHPDIAKVAFRDWTFLTGERLAMQIDRRRNHSRVLRDSIDLCRLEGLIPRDANVGLMTNFINGAVAASNVWFKPRGPQSPTAVGKAFGDMAIAVVLGRGVPNIVEGNRDA